ncbi:hypothetical protein NCAS_0B02100 [Naumovozyma castellii]|uniref:GDT1 family protein n=1 Tax=Naumovozyma castellii TaxID=27288 RepID=G0VBG8_NAUCA|nr:hypothetical protein NCAS_0B02100 [Naumovozyma castellii CBS 4309]CCC68294.1 hypothetical protein NCAS_0B02100 [Naumovozyma castellii CBS 4309]
MKTSSKNILILASLAGITFAASTSQANAKTSPDTSALTGTAANTQEVAENISQPRNSFFMAVSMIGFSEIGDKTFLIAALMAMRHPRFLVYSAAASSLAIMTILSGIAGHTFSYFIPEQITSLLAGLLFLVFGYKLTMEGLSMEKVAGVNEEMAEVEEEIALNDIDHSSKDLEKGPMDKLRSKKNCLFVCLDKVQDLASYILSPVFVQVFAMTFLGELGDRSQISIIALASNNDYWYAIAGAIVGHLICSGVAVIGGRYLATKISMRTITLTGAVLFYLFALMYIYQCFTFSGEPTNV